MKQQLTAQVKGGTDELRIRSVLFVLRVLVFSRMSGRIAENLVKLAALNFTASNRSIVAWSIPLATGTPHAADTPAPRMTTPDGENSSVISRREALMTFWPSGMYAAA
jgi:hypothetical protein